MFAYRLILTLLGPFVVLALIWRVLRRQESWADMAERLGRGSGETAKTWLHGASNGELTSARPLIEALLADDPGQRFAVTCNTTTARRMVQAWGLDQITVSLAPLDFRWAVRRFLAGTQPERMLVIENEIWPNRLMLFQGPISFVAARMSERALGRWRRAGGITDRVLSRINYLAPQDKTSGDHFVNLGVAANAVAAPVDLKALVSLGPPNPAELGSMEKDFDRSSTVLAASVHVGEEEVILDAFKSARAARPDLRLIVAPRHPRRAGRVVVLAKQRELSVARRSTGEAPGNADVYLADTLGEMPLWYSLSGVTIVCGSFRAFGGHTPFEPASFKSAILHGPHVANFQTTYEALDLGGGALCVETTEELSALLSTANLGGLLETGPKAAAMCLSSMRNDTMARLLAELQQVLTNSSS